MVKQYQKTFIENIKKQHEYLEQKHYEEYDEMYRWLHTIKGTGATIGLGQVADTAEKAMTSLNTEAAEESRKEYAEKIMNMLGEESGGENTFFSSDVSEEESSFVLLGHTSLHVLYEVKEQLETLGHHVLIASDRRKLMEKIEEFHPEMVLLSEDLAVRGERTIIKRIKDAARDTLLPVAVFCTGAIDREKADKLYNDGASFVIKPPYSTLEIVQVIHRHLEWQAPMKEALTVDELTGAYNRKMLELEENRLWAEFKRSGKPFSVALTDLDHFKQINDSYGHEEGDQVLRWFVSHMLSRKRPSDLLIRLGGDEFLFIFQQTFSEETEKIMKRLQQSFADFVLDQHLSYRLGFTAGTSTATTGHASLQELINEADAAMLEAKDSGRNAVVSYSGATVIDLPYINVFIIDDDEAMASFVADQFHQLNIARYRIRTTYFSSGEVFFENENYERGQRYFVVLDVTMPGMDGFEVLEKLRGKYPSSNMVVLMLTGNRNEEDIVHALELGADDYLMKPFRKEELVARAKRLIQRVL
ncbi:diguanylate cyclase [Marinococcus luteus]|uniref:diguanylate cyclase n=1 Tax=Marinococcus luteus TaxID=1122204 RepID=UPI002ACC89A7|nr:diguanylate cyclase [Marinococcus luteus]MDZ5783312.1 diguanylate cyclase [Marinococcus luteus]